MVNYRENQLLELALDAFKRYVHHPVQIDKALPGRQAYYELRIGLTGKILRYHAEVKANITKTAVALLLLQRVKHKQNLLLVTRYVNPQMAEELKAQRLEFIDAAGNAYINQPPLYIYVKGNKPPAEIMQPSRTATFKPTGLKVIYAFLCNAGLETKPYRDIATQADVALGTVGWFMRDLKEGGYLIEMGKKGYKIIQKENLFQKWVEAYPERLRPKLIIGRFQGEPGWWEHKKLQPNMLWGGEFAAAKLTKYLKPQVITVYTVNLELNKFLLENKLKKDPRGNVEVLKTFWRQDQAFQNEDMVNPILVYADLIATGDQRNRETARLIYEKYVARLVRENR